MSDDDDDDDKPAPKTAPQVKSTEQVPPKDTKPPSTVPQGVPSGAPPGAPSRNSVAASENIRETMPDKNDPDMQAPDFNNPPVQEKKKSIAELAKLINPATLNPGAARSAANPLMRKREDAARSTA